ncbi:T9SS type A sorting domain-containing protein [Flavobacterium ajazii]|uniref:T9SS type A sorting domain-containing protein n=1 Tax=Flavobacterium ajazii TaxID=2692318 RepID=UPI0013D7FD57|nr:T9SS type A sorting domain-containing protein [Flavobacterium ajazii]
MKKILLGLLLLFTNFFYAQVSDIEHCAGDTSFNLTSQKTLLIGNLNPNETIVSYHISLADATNNTNAIANPTNYVSSTASKTIYARIDNNGAVTTNYFNLIITPYLNSSLLIEQIISCQNEKGKITIQSTGGKGPYTYSIDYGKSYISSNIFTDLVEGVYVIMVKDALGCQMAITGTMVSYKPLEATYAKTDISCNGNNDGSISINATGGRSPHSYSLDGGLNFVSSNVFTNLAAGTYKIAIKDDNGCVVSYMATISEPVILSATAAVENQTITINATGGSGSYMYAISPNLNQFFTDSIFSNLTPGIYTVVILDKNAGCYLIKEIAVNPPSPLINGKNAINFDFTPGQTLADIVVDGQNIKWYSSQNSTGKTSKAAATTLPLTTVLVDGTTYYASQTINNVESTQRLAVTAKSNGALSNDDFVLPNFKFYPNPVKNKLSLSNTDNIDEIEIFSVSGKSVLVKKINNVHSEIDLSNISTGVYFLKVKSEGKIKTIKIIKE